MNKSLELGEVNIRTLVVLFIVQSDGVGEHGTGELNVLLECNAGADIVHNYIVVVHVVAQVQRGARSTSEGLI